MPITGHRQTAYAIVREHLGRAAERMKQQYDLRVRPQKFQRGELVLYYNPRKIQGRQQKWQRRYTPYLVVKELPPVNYLVQKSKKSQPIISHVDKLRKWSTDELPKSWLSPQDNEIGEQQLSPVTVGIDMNETELKRTVIPMTNRKGISGDSATAPLSTIIAGDPASVVPQQQRPRRNVQLPIRYRNYCALKTIIG